MMPYAADLGVSPDLRAVNQQRVPRVTERTEQPEHLRGVCALRGEQQARARPLEDPTRPPLLRVAAFLLRWQFGSACFAAFQADGRQSSPYCDVDRCQPRYTAASACLVRACLTDSRRPDVHPLKPHLSTGKILSAHLGPRHPRTMTWCFRIRVNLRPTSKLQCEEHEWIIDQPNPGQQVKLVALATTSLAEARRVALRGEGYATEAAAVSAGQEWRARLMKAFLPLPVGADFGDRAPHGSFTEHGLAAYAPGQRALNDVHGLMIFECEPAPVFISMDIPAWTISSPHERLVAAMAYAIDTGGLSEARQVSYDLWAASFGQESAEARFALLMIALEAMIDPDPRSEQCRQHVDFLIRATKNSGLPTSEVASMVGVLNWLRNESIGQAGKNLARTLEPRQYNGMAPAAFFNKCYAVRSRLVHGLLPLPTLEEIGRWASPLQEFVADLLSGPQPKTVASVTTAKRPVIRALLSYIKRVGGAR